MCNRNRMILISLIITTLGIGQLLNALQVVGGVDWVWTLLLASGGVVTLWLGAFDKLSFVAGLFLIVAAIGSYLRQTGRIAANVEVPSLIVVLGVLMLTATFAPLPTPSWIRDPKLPPNK